MEGAAAPTSLVPAYLPVVFMYGMTKRRVSCVAALAAKGFVCKLPNREWERVCGAQANHLFTPYTSLHPFPFDNTSMYVWILAAFSTSAFAL